MPPFLSSCGGAGGGGGGGLRKNDRQRFGARDIRVTNGREKAQPTALETDETW